MKKGLLKVSPEEVKNKILLGFEFGLIISEVAKTLNIEVTQELSIIAEDILLKEMELGDHNYFAKEMQNITSAVFGTYEEQKKNI